MIDLSIIPECFVDTNLIETLEPPVRRGGQQGYNHQKGCGTVANLMQQLHDTFALGIIDKDKQQVDYLKEFDLVIQSGPLLLHRHRDAARNHYIIQISPAIETFILNAAATAGLSVVDFDLPEDFEKFKRECKREQSKKDERFKRLFQALRRAGVAEVVRLGTWVRYLKAHPYNADVSELAAL